MSRIILLNKPYQIVSQFTGGSGANLAQFIPHKHFYPAGRLDKDSEGLLLLTDDGKLQHKISHPKFNKKKHYWVQVEGLLVDDDLNPLRQGIVLKDGQCKPIDVSIIDEPKLWPRNPPVRFRKSIPCSWLEIAMSEGKNRQIRRMSAAIGFPTLRLIRYRIGDWMLDSLKPGEFKLIDLN